SSTCAIALSTYSVPSTARRVCKPFFARSSWLRLSMRNPSVEISVVFDARNRFLRRNARVRVDPFGDASLGFRFGDRVGRLECRVFAAFGVRSRFGERGERAVFGSAVRRAPIDAVRALDELDALVGRCRLGVLLPALRSLPLLHARLRSTNPAGPRQEAGGPRNRARYFVRPAAKSRNTPSTIEPTLATTGITTVSRSCPVIASGPSFAVCDSFV